MRIAWERIDGSQSEYDVTERMSVTGGWLVRTRRHFSNSREQCIALIFKKDVHHEWKIQQQPKEE